MTAMSGVGFMEGGYTGNGRRDEVAGPVHRGEYVFNSEATARIGVGTLEAMANGKAAMIRPSGSGGGDSSSSGPAPIVFNAPVTVQAQPGMSEQQAQMQGESISAGLESRFGQFLDREMRQGGRLWRRN
jgi:phage-related minor tail protein